VLKKITVIAVDVRAASVCIAFFTVFASPDLRGLVYENSKSISLHIDHAPLFVGLEIPNLAQVAVRNCLTDVNQPFSIHLIQSLLMIGEISMLFT
jgi:hypothetical protein